MPKSFPYAVPRELRDLEVRIYGIEIVDEYLEIEFIDKEGKPRRIKSYIIGDKEDDIDTIRKMTESQLSYYFNQATTSHCTEKIVSVIDKLYDTDAGYAIDRIRKKRRIENKKLDEQGGLVKGKEIQFVKKYSGATTTNPNGVGLAEAVIINCEPMFGVSLNSDSDNNNNVTFYKELETGDMILRPPPKQQYPPDSAYEFSSEDEFMECIRVAIEEETLYTLYRDVRKYYSKDYFVDIDPRNSTFLALYTIISYFQDKFSTVPYVWLVGDNGSGKNSILITYASLGYRVFYMSGASGANICEYLGTVEEGQGTIAEDELDNLDKDPYKKLLYMTGYASGNCVPKILDGNTKGRDQQYYRSYCKKMSASENLPSIKYSKGVLDREFVIKCVKGFPKYNSKSIKKRTKTPEVLRLINELQTLRKRLLAFRLVHFDDIIEEIQGLNISGRALELTESALLLFHKYKTTKQDEDIFENEILPTLSSFLSDRLSRRNDSLEGRLYTLLSRQ